MSWILHHRACPRVKPTQHRSTNPAVPRLCSKTTGAARPPSSNEPRQRGSLWPNTRETRCHKPLQLLQASPAWALVLQSHKAGYPTASREENTSHQTPPITATAPHCCLVAFWFVFKQEQPKLCPKRPTCPQPPQHQPHSPSCSPGGLGHCWRSLCRRAEPQLRNSPGCHEEQQSSHKPEQGLTEPKTEPWLPSRV